VARKYYTRVEVAGADKRTSLQYRSINYDHKKVMLDRILSFGKKQFSIKGPFTIYTSDVLLLKTHVLITGPVLTLAPWLMRQQIGLFQLIIGAKTRANHNMSLSLPIAFLRLKIGNVNRALSGLCKYQGWALT
jgi:hypothetical protein